MNIFQWIFKINSTFLQVYIFPRRIQFNSVINDPWSPSWGRGREQQGSRFYPRLQTDGQRGITPDMFTPLNKKVKTAALQSSRGLLGDTWSSSKRKSASAGGVKKPNGSQILTCFQTFSANFLHSSCHLPFHVTEGNFPVSCWAVTEQTERLADQMTSLRHRYALWPTALGQLRGYIRTPGSTASVRRITLRQSKESDCEMSSAAGPITHSTSFLWGIR